MIKWGFYPGNQNVRFDHFYDPLYRRPGGFFAWGGELSQFLPLTIFLVLLKTYLSQKIFLKKTKFDTFFLILFSLALILTLNRTGIFSFIIGMGVFLLVKFNKSSVKLIFLFLAFLMILYSYLPIEVFDRLTFQTYTGSVEGRAELTVDSIAEIKKFPVFLIGTYYTGMPNSHKQIIDEFQKKGIIGLIIIILFYLALVSML